MIRAIVVDDEQGAINILAKHIKRYCGDVRVVATANTISEAEVAILRHKPELVFLDIEMPGGNGFELLDRFKNPSFEVIFITGYDKYAIKAFNYATIDYLLKPIEVSDLSNSIERFKERTAHKFQKERYEFLLQNIGHTAQDFKKIVIPSRKGFKIVNISDIVFCQASRSYCDIHLISGEVIFSSKTLREMEEILPDHLFFRTHKSYLINLNMCSSYENTDEQIILLTKHSIPLTARLKKDFVDKLQQTNT